MTFRDDWDRKAHDIICIVRYGNTGGSVRNDEVRRVSDVLRGHPHRPPAPVLPVVAIARVISVDPLPGGYRVTAVKLPTIKG